MKKLVFLLLGLALGAVSYASTTNITATVTDTDGQRWSNGRWSATIVMPGGVFSGTKATINGVAVPSSASGVMDDNGVLTGVLTDTSSLDQTGVLWKFRVCPNASITPYGTTDCASFSIPITGGALDLTPHVNAVAAPRFPAGLQAFGYSDQEVIPNDPGIGYFNTGKNTALAGQRIWDGKQWIGTPKGSANPAGITGQVQINSSGAFGARDAIGTGALTGKDYVDSGVSAATAAADAANTNANGRVSKGGDTMTGPLVLSGPSTSSSIDNTAASILNLRSATCRSVIEWGAVPSSSDNTSSLQAALDAAFSGGFCLSLGSGTYFTHTLHWRGQSIYGQGITQSSLQGIDSEDVLQTHSGESVVGNGATLSNFSIYINGSIDKSCTPAAGLAPAGDCTYNRPIETNSLLSPGANYHTYPMTVGTGAAWYDGASGVAVVYGTTPMYNVTIDHINVETRGYPSWCSSYSAHVQCSWGAHNASFYANFNPGTYSWHFYNTRSWGAASFLDVAVDGPPISSEETNDEMLFSEVSILSLHGITMPTSHRSRMEKVAIKGHGNSIFGVYGYPTVLVLDSIITPSSTYTERSGYLGTISNFYTEVGLLDKDGNNVGPSTDWVLNYISGTINFSFVGFNEDSTIATRGAGTSIYDLYNSTLYTADYGGLGEGNVSIGGNTYPQMYLCSGLDWGEVCGNNYLELGPTGGWAETSMVQDRGASNTLLINPGAPKQLGSKNVGLYNWSLPKNRISSDGLVFGVNNISSFDSLFFYGMDFYWPDASGGLQFSVQDLTAPITQTSATTYSSANGAWATTRLEGGFFGDADSRYPLIWGGRLPNISGTAYVSLKGSSAATQTYVLYRGGSYGYCEIAHTTITLSTSWQTYAIPYNGTLCGLSDPSSLGVPLMFGSSTTSDNSSVSVAYLAFIPNLSLGLSKLSLGSSQTFTGVQGTTGTKLPAATGTFTAGHSITTDSNGNLVDGGKAITDLVAKSGDTMTGPLVLAADPTSDRQAATKQYVDTQSRAQNYYWYISSSSFATSQMLGPVYVGAALGTNSAFIVRASGTYSCSVSPFVELMDLGSDANTSYASATPAGWGVSTAGIGVSSSIGGPSIIPGHYYGVAISTGTCTTPPTLDVTLYSH